MGEVYLTTLVIVIHFAFEILREISRLKSTNMWRYITNYFEIYTWVHLKHYTAFVQVSNTSVLNFLMIKGYAYLCAYR